ncbi:hypothetical protein [Delftia sp. UGAL515B_04]|uniref:hypothetical protein n=1 Tax=Delftia sp. UGAL515B_04 TaxID=2986766 RepID=UPI002954D88D|nr:hypothetical protein [Delftia sp. UGAL515B_04]WON88662.1 hypothetical protein OK021_28725 [Delftia sp. UGAL515B_04]
MADIYTRLQGTTRRLVRPAAQGGLGQGEIVLTRKTPGTPGPNPWDPVEPVVQSETLGGAVSGISQQLVGTEMGGAILLASDRQAICEPPRMEYQAGDVLSVDGVPVHILGVKRIPAAGTVSAVKFFIRG